MKRRFMEFMNGRYGADDLSKFMLGLAVALLAANLFVGVRAISVASLIVLAACYYRMFSRDYARRSAENQKYLGMVWKLKAHFGKTKKRISQSKEYHIYKCPSCGQKIRIPRGKGKIMVTCPKCKHEFKKKS